MYQEKGIPKKEERISKKMYKLGKSNYTRQGEKWWGEGRGEINFLNIYIIKNL